MDHPALAETRDAVDHLEQEIVSKTDPDLIQISPGYMESTVKPPITARYHDPTAGTVSILPWMRKEGPFGGDNTEGEAQISRRWDCCYKIRVSFSPVFLSFSDHHIDSIGPQLDFN